MALVLLFLFFVEEKVSKISKVNSQMVASVLYLTHARQIGSRGSPSHIAKVQNFCTCSNYAADRGMHNIIFGICYLSIMYDLLFQLYSVLYLR